MHYTYSCKMVGRRSTSGDDVYVCVQVQEEGEEGAGWAVCDRLRQHCREVLELRPCSLPALTATAYLTLVDLTRGL